jgi:hypothetical protein
MFPVWLPVHDQHEPFAVAAMFGFTRKIRPNTIKAFVLKFTPGHKADIIVFQPDGNDLSFMCREVFKAGLELHAFAAKTWNCWDLGYGWDQGDMAADAEASRNTKDLGRTSAWPGAALHDHAGNSPNSTPSLE